MAYTYEAFMTVIDCQIEKATGCAGYEAFKADVESLKAINTGYGLPAITANVWLHKICELSDADLCAYVERYQAGLLDARYTHYPFVGKPLPPEVHR